jgi:hypothetical protein
MLQTQTVTAGTLALTKKMMADTRLNNFVLVGGTALALTIGHRQSIDIDLFSQQPFDAAEIAGILKSDYRAENVKTLGNAVFCFINGIKVDLIAHSYPEVELHRTIDDIRISSLPDVAAMKLHAIVQNGSRIKDFADIYFLLEKMPLGQMLAAYENKYFPNASGAVAKIALNDTTHVNLKDEIMLVNRQFDWPQIKERLTSAIQSQSKIFLPPSNHQSIKDTPPKKKNRGIRH